MDRHIPASSGEEAISSYSSSTQLTDSTDAYASSPEEIPLKQFTVMEPTHMPQHSSVKKNISKY